MIDETLVELARKSHLRGDVLAGIEEEVPFGFAEEFSEDDMMHNWHESSYHALRFQITNTALICLAVGAALGWSVRRMLRP